MDLLEAQAQRHIVMMAMLRSWLTRCAKAVKFGLNVAGLGQINSYPILSGPGRQDVLNYVDLDKKMAQRYPHLVGLNYVVIESIYGAMCSSDDPSISIARGRVVLAEMTAERTPSKADPCENCSSKPSPYAGMESYYDCHMCQLMS